MVSLQARIDDWSANPGPSRRSSTETIYSIQGRETDYIQDTDDTETFDDDFEYEPVTETDDEKPSVPGVGQFSDESESDLIVTNVIEVTVSDDNQGLADEEYQSDGRDPEMRLRRYQTCAHCRMYETMSPYRYCDTCFRLRRNLFPPRPKRRNRRKAKSQGSELASQSQPSASGSQGYHGSQAESLAAGTLSQDSAIDKSSPEADGIHEINTPGSVSGPDHRDGDVTGPGPDPEPAAGASGPRKRASSLDRSNKRIRLDHDAQSDVDSDYASQPSVVAALTKTVSDPAVAIQAGPAPAPAGPPPGAEAGDGLCIVCVAEPKSGVFVHGRVAHICCCYRCALKVWARTKRCPVCNSKVSNVLKAVVM